MQRAFGGYTLIEVMIFLAVSSVLLFVTVGSIRGQQAHTEFSSSINDVNSKFQQWIDTVSNGFSGNTADTSSNLVCHLDGTNHPKLMNAASGNAAGANPDCVFLGKALQINTDTGSSDSQHIYAYTVLGRRTFLSSGVQSTVDNLVDANPKAAIFPGVADLTEDYKIPNGLKVISVNSTVNPGSRLAGIFTSFNTSGNSKNNGSTSIMAVQYPMTSNWPGKNSNVLDCLEFAPFPGDPCKSPPTTNGWPMKTWQICFGSTANDDRGLLAINSSNGFGASSHIDKTGPGAC
jgi:type II secretory pathway pseudopilin PulG